MPLSKLNQTEEWKCIAIVVLTTISKLKRLENTLEKNLLINWHPVLLTCLPHGKLPEESNRATLGLKQHKKSWQSHP